MQPEQQMNLNQDPKINVPGEAKEKGISPFRMAFRRFLKNKAAVVSIFVLAIIILLCLCAPLLTDYDPIEYDLLKIDQKPSSEHILGTDNSGRDVFSRLLYGGRISIIIGFSAMFFTLVIGVTLGAIAGYYGGKVDNIIMRITDIFMILPFLVLVLVIVAILEKVTIQIFVTIIALTSWPSLTRIVRGSFLSLREREFVLGARAIGASDFRIIFRHFIPNAIGPIVVNATLMVATYIVIESGLSFIGFGIPQPTPTWGNMLSSALSVRVLQYHPEQWVPPGLMILLTVLCINFIGDGLRDAFDPKSKKR